VLSRYRSGDTVTLHAFRRDELMAFAATLAPDDAPQIALSAQPKPTISVRKRNKWLLAQPS
jgi:predicted metalloprotease with PDZ domain